MTVAPSPVVYESWGQRVVFGSGTVRKDVAAAVKGLGASRVLVIAADGERALAEDICKDLPVVAVFGGVRPHVPADVAQAVRAAAREHAADLLLSVGGGSTTGTAKAAALTTGLPILAVPTTYAGSEATPSGASPRTATSAPASTRKCSPASSSTTPHPCCPCRPGCR